MRVCEWVDHDPDDACFSEARHVFDMIRPHGFGYTSRLCDWHLSREVSDAVGAVFTVRPV